MATTATFDILKGAAEKVSSMKKTPNAAKAYAAVLEKLRAIFNGGPSESLADDITKLKRVGTTVRSGTDMTSQEAEQERAAAAAAAAAPAAAPAAAAAAAAEAAAKAAADAAKDPEAVAKAAAAAAAAADAEANAEAKPEANAEAKPEAKPEANANANAGTTQGAATGQGQETDAEIAARKEAAIRAAPVENDMSRINARADLIPKSQPPPGEKNPLLGIGNTTPSQEIPPGGLFGNKEEYKNSGGSRKTRHRTPKRRRSIRRGRSGRKGLSKKKTGSRK